MRPELEDSNRVADVIHDSSSQSVAALDEDGRDGCTLEPFRNGSVIGEWLQQTVSCWYAGWTQTRRVRDLTAVPASLAGAKHNREQWDGHEGLDRRAPTW
jgi:hypothetical protein